MDDYIPLFQLLTFFRPKRNFFQTRLTWSQLLPYSIPERLKKTVYTLWCGTYAYIPIIYLIYSKNKLHPRISTAPLNNNAALIRSSWALERKIVKVWSGLHPHVLSDSDLPSFFKRHLKVSLYSYDMFSKIKSIYLFPKMIVLNEFFTLPLRRSLVIPIFFLRFFFIITPLSGRGLEIPIFFYPAVRTRSSNIHFLFFQGHLPQTSGFPSVNQTYVASFATQARAPILSDRNIYFAPWREGEQWRGVMPLGLFLFFRRSLAPDLHSVKTMLAGILRSFSVYSPEFSWKLAYKITGDLMA